MRQRINLVQLLDCSLMTLKCSLNNLGSMLLFLRDLLKSARILLFLCK